MGNPVRFHVRTWPEKLAGEPGFSYLIRDQRRVVVGGGWSRGSKRHALDDARATIARLQNTTRRAS